jgi:hypothetical protein
MTTISVFGIAGPISDTSGNRLESNTEYKLLNKVSKTPIVIPAGHIVTEIAMRRRADANTDLTPGRGISVGFEDDPRVLIGTPGVITDELNQFVPETFITLDENNCPVTNTREPYVPYTHFLRLDPSTNVVRIQRSSHENRTVVLQSAFGGNVTSGGVSVVIKYKPFSDSIAERFG